MGGGRALGECLWGGGGGLNIFSQGRNAQQEKGPAERGHLKIVKNIFDTFRPFSRRAKKKKALDGGNSALVIGF